MEFRAEQTIIRQMVQNAIQRGLIKPSEDILEKLEAGYDTENQYILDLATHATQITAIEQLIQTIYLAMNIDTATGEDLDNLGKLLNVHRVQPQSSLVEVTVSLTTAADTDYFIPRGTYCTFVEIRENGSDYITREDVTINAGVTETTIVCESIIQDYLPLLAEGAINGLDGFDDLTVTNNEESTSGKPIETDTEYRERIKTWFSRNIKGTGDCIRTYLDNYTGLDGYVLIPLFDGNTHGKAGWLTVVCDTLQSNLPLIRDGLYNDCMLQTDFPPNCILPTDKVVENLILTVKRGDTTSMISNEELSELLIAQTKVYVSGGLNREGFRQYGLGIGGSLNPSKLIAFLVGEFPECENISLSLQNRVNVEPTEKLKLNSVGVVFE